MRKKSLYSSQDRSKYRMKMLIVELLISKKGTSQPVARGTFFHSFPFFAWYLLNVMLVFSFPIWQITSCFKFSKPIESNGKDDVIPPARTCAFLQD